MNSASEYIYTRVFTKRYSSRIENSLVVSNSIIGKNPPTSARADRQESSLPRKQAHSFRPFGTGTAWAKKGPGARLRTTAT